MIRSFELRPKPYCTLKETTESLHVLKNKLWEVFDKKRNALTQIKITDSLQTIYRELTKESPKIYVAM